MELNFNFTDPPKGPQIQPVFLDVAAEIEKLEEESRNHQAGLVELRENFDAKMAALQARYFADKEKMVKEQEERVARLRALKEKAAKDAELEVYAETARIVKEIVADLPTWTMVHEYQMEDIISIVHAYIQGEKGFLNANDMGMGKTLEAVVSLFIISRIFEKDHGYKPSILWLTKQTILKTKGTENEAKRWWPEMYLVPLNGSSKKEDRVAHLETIRGLGFPMITNYEAVRTTPELSQDYDWDIIVMDEVHKLKGGAQAKPTAIWTAVRDVTPKAKFILMLSGTPMPNKGDEMWSYLHIFDPVLFSDSAKFRRDFEAYQKIAGEWQYAIDIDMLLEKALKGRMVRRSAKEVGLQLPELTMIEKVLPMNDQQQQLYNQMKEQFFIWLEEQDEILTASAIIAQLTRLRQIALIPMFTQTLKDESGNVISEKRIEVHDSCKADETMEIIENTTEQIVIFSNLNDILKEIKMRCDKAGVSCELLIGENSKNLGRMEVDFQQGLIRVLCINSSMGEGMNLQKSPDKWPGGASFGIELDRWWNEARDNQCIARIYRQGAVEPVFFYRMFAENSVDYFVQAISQGKAVLSGKLMDADAIRPKSEWKKFLKEMI